MGGYFSALRARTRRVAFEIKYDPEDPDAAIQSVIDRRGLDGFQWRYPLSSIIAAEWSSTKSRGRMMAAVFLMQSVGQLAAYGFGLAILVGVSKRLGLSPEEKDRGIAAPKIDAIWRAIIGVGAFPALVSLVLRRTIPETPYYLVETGRVTDAVTAAREVYAPGYTLQPTGHDALSPMQTMSNGPTEKTGKQKGSWWANTTEHIRESKEHLSQKSRWRILLGVMFTWWLLDLAYYGLGLDNPKTISEIWLWYAPDPSRIPLLGCDTAQDVEIYNMLYGNIVRNIATISSGTLPGSIIILFAIDYVPRVTWMAWTFVVLAALFAVNGGTLFIAFETDKHGLTILLYVLAQVIFNLGPNTMTFILPAELFATKFRGTFYGLAAASGKLGAITILLIKNLGVYGGKTFLPSGVPFAKTLLGFVPAMLLGAFITWAWIPEVQFPRGHGTEIMRDENASDDGTDEDLQERTFGKKLKLPNRPLAHIAHNPDDGQVLGVRRNLIRLIRRVRGNHRRDSTSYTLESGVDDISRTVDSSGAHYMMHPQPFSEHEIDLDSGDLGARIATSHLLGKKSWNVYNPANIERVRRDEAEALARAELEEKQREDREAERRLAILRGEIPPEQPSPPSPTEPSSAPRTDRKRERDGDLTAQFRGGERRKRKRFGEDDTDFEMRVARERTDAAATSTVARLSSSNKTSNAPIVDSRGHISLFPEDGKGRETGGNQKNEEAEREAAKKRREFEDQYTMRFSNAAGRDGVGVTGSGPWYASNGATDLREPAEAEVPGKDAWGNEDPKRKARDAARVVANDPLAMMKRGAAKVRDVERERRTLNEEKARELKQLRKEEKRREKRWKHNDVDELEGFSLDARSQDTEDRKRERGRREHRSGSRDRDGRDKHRHRRSSDHDDDRERRHRHYKDNRHEDSSHNRHSRRDREDGERHSSGHSRRQLAKTDHY
ncbi:hypothetical protein GQX73_g7929 [Xylaria multiplex]|uniref:CBF1-interacting co-repressor CIR N-terminal domain-containing protein n=1 Tax=Xylaria multiplex TaxID=323545 RepID=A0A7C8INI9_9PEZI|nr:hypothetical protein GQX73_g7929 [Xylaria multiplex]